MRFEQIVRFNWPFYAVAAAVTAAAPFVLPRLPALWWIRVPAYAGAGLVADRQTGSRVVVLGLPTRFMQHGEAHHILTHCGLDVDGIERTVRAHLA